MSERTFDAPVFVRDGGFVQEITCLEDALEFLYEWPRNRRGPIYNTALRACQRAFDSDYPLLSARSAFMNFAKSANVYEEVSQPLPWMAGRSPHSAGGIRA